MTALILGCNGVLADTELYGHLPAFNGTFAHFNLPVMWTETDYADKLQIAGGKERMASLLRNEWVAEKVHIPPDPAGRAALLADWHHYKTAVFTELVRRGAVPPRPGIRRIITGALERGWTVVVASTSARASAREVLVHAVGAATAERITVFTGDVVPAKKPDPAIYRLAIERTGIDPADAVAIEDNRNGLLAATRAGLPCLVTVNGYTRDEDFSEAALVVSELGDRGRPAVEVLADPFDVRPGRLVELDDLVALIARTRNAPGA